MSQSGSGRPVVPAGGTGSAIGRRPHEGAGPCVRYGGRRPGRSGGRRPGGHTSAVAAVLVVAALLAGAALLAACGGSSGSAAPPPTSAGAAPSRSAAPTPAAAASRPFVGSPGQAVAAYWALVDTGDYAGLRAACTPDSAAALTPASSDIRRARLLRVARVLREPGGAQVQADVRIVPAGTATPWGEPGARTLFIKLTETTGGGWLVTSWGTGP